MSRRNRQTGMEEVLGVSFRDIALTLFFIMGASLVLLLMLPHNPKMKNEEAERSRGNLRVEMYWPDDMDVDIDLWTKAPYMVPVGYSNMNGPIMNLVRDDLGNHADFTDKNYEIAFSRGIPPGEYVVNIKWFSSAQYEIKQVPVMVMISLVRNDSNAGAKERPEHVIQTEVVLHDVKEEITILRFTITDDLKITNRNSDFVPLSTLEER